MKLTILPTGQLAVNTYFVPLAAPVNGLTPVIVVDPGDDGGAIVAALQANALQAAAVALTHHHFDHVLGLTDILEAFPGIHAGSFEPSLVRNNQPTPDIVFAEGTTLDCLFSAARMPQQNNPVVSATDETMRAWMLTAAAWRVLHTPGHTVDSVCFYNETEKTLISGDTLFWRTYGRTDFPGGSDEQMAQSLKRLFALPPDTLVYPGHDRYGFALAANRFRF